ncbi:hypothetical protein Trco_004539 [Trichoderma cornu-damae]|uniref:Uncharacterized protein n=1 Tax=Trichoderma cornu-damae TaxID=654480 RepID=A0A9P8TU90_9HYPO|nr:hypothetical protein Trco_004539 [Trichoderma cornu-damae]
MSRLGSRGVAGEVASCKSTYALHVSNAVQHDVGQHLSGTIHNQATHLFSALQTSERVAIGSKSAP